MPPAPLTAAILTGATGSFGLVHLAVDPTPFVDQRALLVAAGMAVLTLVVTTGILLSRGRWSRWSLLCLGATWLGMSARTDLDPLALSVIVGGAAMITIAAGPWLPRWLRHRPSAEGPPPAAVILLLSLLAMPVLVGVVSTRVGTAEWAMALWSLGLALGISRALPVALWAGRLLHPPAIVLGAAAVGFPSGLGLIAVAAAQTALLWRRDLHIAVSPLMPDAATAVPIPPELVDPAILRSAGLDERGTRVEDR